MNERLTRFTELMRSIFELDKSDLDFGIYRIMNIRKNRIEDFLTKDLPKRVQETLEPFTQDGTGVSQRMKEIEDTAKAAGIQVSDSPVWAAEYEALKKKKAAGADLSALETDVYSALYSFFNRYYDEGDFISKRRYKEGVYAIPYEGEEVKLYWANHDQYYIKTSENFKDYTFLEQGISVHFRLVDATTEKDNIKEADDSKRVFMLFTEDEENYPGIPTFEYAQGKRELIIRFVFDIPEDKKRKYAEENYAAIKDKIVKEYDDLIVPLLRDVSKDPKKPKTVLQRHLEAYVAKNTFDYFIHKDLGGFLRRELDFYIKNEVMRLDDLDTENEQRVETWLAKVRAIKRVGHVIIDFLAQLEDFQKKLWLKKKFVVETNWCITLDRIDQSFWPEIAENEQQVQEWIDLYAIQEVEGWTNPPCLEFLKNNQNLIVDTMLFTPVFKERVIATIDNLQHQITGTLINGDNYHAIQLLKSLYVQKAKCLYLDPPFNAKSSEILYKNTFKHSAWLSLMENRLEIARTLLKETGVLIVAIDEIENHRLGMLLDATFPEYSVS
ncbi:MAG: DNA methyltransferase [Christensenellales bacterium]|jgi:adenine-specific DNA-methyltransferase